MYTNATARFLTATVLLAQGVFAQAPAPLPQVDWRRVGNSAIDRSLAGLATGPVDRVWFSASGSLLIHSSSGRVFETTDFESWKASAASTPPEAPVRAANLPEPGARLRASSPSAAILYAVGKFAYRSENDGASWDNLTNFRGTSILGNGLNDLAVSPTSDDQIVVAGVNGVFRSMDGGKSWSGLNQDLPNLPAAKIVSLPVGDHGVKLSLPDSSEVEWQPGQKIAWSQADNTEAANDAEIRQVLSRRLNLPVTSYAVSGDYLYAGLAAGLVTVSNDGGQTWRPFPFAESGPVERFWVDPNDPRVALAVLGARRHDLGSAIPRIHVVKTENGGLFWDNVTGNLPDIGVHGITADRASGGIYAATDAGVFMTYANLGTLGVAPQWRPVPGLPGAADDVKLDAQGNQLWASAEGYGVYATLAPHRLLDPRVVSTADLVARATAPGSLISVLGARVQAARAGDIQVPVLSATENESQLQIPFEATGSTFSLAVDRAEGRIDASIGGARTGGARDFRRSRRLARAPGWRESGLIARRHEPGAFPRPRFQIMATGLGRVKPDWPTGLGRIPPENPPEVVANVKAYLDNQPVEVTRATTSPLPRLLPGGDHGPEDRQRRSGRAVSRSERPDQQSGARLHRTLTTP